MDSLIEKNLHDIIMEKPIQARINEILGITNDDKTVYIHEDKYINGIVADFTIRNSNEIWSIVEVKGGNIGVTDYVRGIGQTFQYEYFKEENIKYEHYSNQYRTMLVLHSNTIQSNSFNIAKFKYPKSLIIVEINGVSKAVRVITEDELNVLKRAENHNLTTISQYYFRDNRIFEYYIALHYLLCKQLKGEKDIKRKEVENFLMKTKTINNGNWRNVFITLSSLGLINSKNMLTDSGKRLASMEYEDCAVEMYNAYIKNYADEIIACFNNENELNMNNLELGKKINTKFNNREVLFLTQSGGRYISSWLNILRDDYGIIRFKARETKKTLVYNPNDLKDKAFADKIRNNNTIAYNYIDKYMQLL